MSEKDHQVSRRQFLTYTLTGVGGFMAAGIAMPLTKFAVAPVLKKETGADFVAVTKVDKVTNEPQRFDFKVKVVDGWYTSEEVQTAWIYKNDEGEIIAFSPVCKHLGCTVQWNGSKDFQNEFFCPCHNGRYEKNGKNVPGTPPLKPLDHYELQVKDGTIFLGRAKEVK